MFHALRILYVTSSSDATMLTSPQDDATLEAATTMLMLNGQTVDKDALQAGNALLKLKDEPETAEQAVKIQAKRR